MAELQNRLDGKDHEGHLGAGTNGEPHLTADVAQPPSTSAPPDVEGDVQDGVEGIPVAIHEEAPVGETKTRERKFVCPLPVFVLVAFIMSVVLARGLYHLAGREKSVLPYPVPTDREGLRKTLEAVEEGAERLRNKFWGLPGPWREQFMNNYSLRVATDNFTEEQFGSWFNYALFLKTLPIPEETDSIEEREGYALRNLLFSTLLRCATERLDTLSRHMELLTRRDVPFGFSMEGSILPPLWYGDPHCESVSFGKFTRRLETLGVVGVAQGGDSGPTVSTALADNLAFALAIRKIYEDSDRVVTEECERFLASVEQVTKGKTKEEARRMQSLAMPGLTGRFPVPILAKAVERARLKGASENFPLSAVLNLRSRWDDVGVSSAVVDVKFLHRDTFVTGANSKLSALYEYDSAMDIEALSGSMVSLAFPLI
ncbi:hypothetical protein EAH_00036120 [Eimeria acervulina]|uniref:Transmembrane protein n=1 Tax=Eimeria acervulina TaxID=5801 RepID=U6GT39_EIMAC|nr:hypothetical protein EAH_00036120 [Eimeria acervulina]CDI83340.1 hypothetical protein EAH_00036120 [Eimeria acervulina]